LRRHAFTNTVCVTLPDDDRLAAFILSSHNMLRLKALPIIGVLALAACADTPVQPLAPVDVVRAAPLMAARADGAGTYLIQFKGDRIPADFDGAVANIGGTVLFAHEATGLAVVSAGDAATAAKLGTLPSVDAVEADGYTLLAEPKGSAPKVMSADNPAGAAAFFGQWNLPAVNAPAAWAQGNLGSPTVRVGILDTGIDYLHPEFFGILDRGLSRSFVDEAVPTGADMIADLSGHGTLVASLAASNAELTAGIGSKVTLVSLKVCNKFDECGISATLRGVVYAAEQGLEVINLSVGGPQRRKGLKNYQETGVNMIRAINKAFAYAHRRGVTIVVSAGNDATNMDRDKGMYQLYCDAPHVICVSATGPTFANFADDGSFTDIENIDAPAVYSNFGRNVTVAAPGGNLFVGGSEFVDIIGACSGFVEGCLWDGERGIVVNFGIGTSMAAPHVAGLAALLASEPGFSGRPSKIASRIKRTADDLGSRGRDPHYGYGRINVGRALDRSFTSNDEDSDRDR
jgi:subtilisin family serine protease